MNLNELDSFFCFLIIYFKMNLLFIRSKFMNRCSIIIGIIGLIGLGYTIKNLINEKNNESFDDEDSKVSYLIATNTNYTKSNSINSRTEIKNIVTRIYKNILETNYSSSTLNSWINKLATKQTTLYNFLLSIISPKINSLNVTTLIKSLYLGVLDREPTINESSKLLTVFNDELRQYGSKDRALKKLLTYFVKTSSIVRYCNQLGVNSI